MLLVILVAVTILGLILFALGRCKRKNTIAIFHLYCSSGGGGERVLWHMVRSLLKSYPNYTIYIYTHRDHTQKDLHDELLHKVRNLFKIDLTSDRQAIERLKFKTLLSSPFIEAKRYPFLTLLFQNFMSIVIALEAAYRHVPEVYMETIGFSFTMLIFKLLGCTVITYVHYPTISNDMIDKVITGSHASFNNREIFARNSWLRNLKLMYYRCLAYMYGFAGRQADLVMVNSSWTKHHIQSLWKIQPTVVYPPCDVSSFKSLRLDRFRKRPNGMNIISIAQFRPEKNHQLQIEAFDDFLHQNNRDDCSLTLYGGCRDKDDERRVEYLRDLIGRLELDSKVRLVVNASFEELMKGVEEADVAVHTMVNEHFGIVLLEFMAAGLITVAHNSGGPRVDIINDGINGYLANDLAQFSEKLTRISKMQFDERQHMRTSAVEKSEHFSVQIFERDLIRLTRKYFIEIEK